MKNNFALSHDFAYFYRTFFSVFFFFFSFLIFPHARLAHDPVYHAWYFPSLSLSSNLLSYPLCDMYSVLFITIVYTIAASHFRS